MCGIAGICALRAGQPVDEGVLTAMTRVLHHRGPDDEGFFVAPGQVGLGMRRLSIIDVDGGGQPIANEDGTVQVVYNGEIYNFRELRADLEARGHRFRTHTDTEVIVHAYEEFGDEAVSRFRGMFTFAIWDVPRRRLLIARDRVGIKQLFYTVADGQLLFGSELKAILAHPAVERRISPSGVNHYLTFAYVPAPLTIFEGIHELEPGHLLIAENGAYAVKPYWELEYAVDRSRSYADTVTGLRAHLEDAVRLRLISDVPLGAFLSGGIDSGTIVALMAKHSAGPVRTFSIGYEHGGEFFDERPYAAMVATQYATEHHEFVVDPALHDIIDGLIGAFDQPFADPSAIPNWYLSEMTRREVTVALSGLGGDELLAGYERYRGCLLAEHVRRAPAWMRGRLLRTVLDRVPDSRRGNQWVERVKRFARSLDLPFDARYLELISAFNGDLRRDVLSPAMQEQINLDEPHDRYMQFADTVRDADPLNRALFSDLKLYLPGDLLTLTDRISMAHSLEVRVPFLDQDLLAYAATIPPEWKLRRFERKHILKRAVADLLPPELLHRRKMGFSSPLALWFRQDLRPFVEDVLAERAITDAGVFQYPAVRRILDDHFGLRANRTPQIWTLMMFMLWYHAYMTPARSATMS